MPRIRSIKPQFWLNEDLATIPREARLLYIGLWNLSDDRGVFEYRPSRIKAQLFPYDDDVTVRTIAGWLEALKQIKDIVYFTENCKPFGYIPTFLDHQQIQHPSRQHFTTSLPTLNESSMSNSSPHAQLSMSPHEPSINVGRYKEGGGEKDKLPPITPLKDENNFKQVRKGYEDMTGRLVTEGECTQLLELMAEYPADKILTAFTLCTEQSVRKLSYARKILENGGNAHKEAKPFVWDVIRQSVAPGEK